MTLLLQPPKPYNDTILIVENRLKVDMVAVTNYQITAYVSVYIATPYNSKNIVFADNVVVVVVDENDDDNNEMLSQP